MRNSRIENSIPKHFQEFTTIFSTHHRYNTFVQWKYLFPPSTYTPFHSHIHSNYPPSLLSNNISSPPHTHLLQNPRKPNHLIQQSLTLPRRILRNLIPQMIHLLTRLSRPIPLRSLNPRDLHLQKELWDLNRQTPPLAANPRFSGEVHI